MWYNTSNETGHYRVITGYNQTGFFLHDPWDEKRWGGQYSGPNLFFDNALFEKLWTNHNNWVLILESGRPYDGVHQPISDYFTVFTFLGTLFIIIVSLIVLYRRNKNKFHFSSIVFALHCVLLIYYVLISYRQH